MSLVRVEYPDSESICGIWKLEESKVFFTSQLDLRYCTGYQDIHNEGKQVQWLACRFLAKLLIEEHWHEEFEGLVHDQFGKPSFSNLPYHISISNSKGYVAVIIHKSLAIGIDVEEIKDKIQSVAARFLQPEELSFLGNDNLPLTAAWCFKEAVYKIHGKKNIGFREHIRIEPFQYDIHGGRAEVSLLGLNKVEQHLLKYFIIDGYMFAYNYYIER